MPKLKYRTKMPHADDPDILEAVYDGVAYGVPLAYIGPEIGVSAQTLRYWLWQGNQELAAREAAAQCATDEALPEPGAAALFANTVNSARSALIRDRVAVVRQGAAGWAAAMTLLERLIPTEFARRTDVHVESTVNVTPQLPAGYTDYLSQQPQLPEGSTRQASDTGDATDKTTPLLSESSGQSE